jgi:hypothetical protein
MKQFTQSLTVMGIVTTMDERNCKFSLDFPPVSRTHG